MREKDITPIMRKILDALKQAPVPLTPLQVSMLSGLPHATCKTYLRTLYLAGFVEKPRPGLYAAITAES